MTTKMPYTVPRVRLMLVREGGDPTEAATMTTATEVYRTYREYFAGLDREEMWIVGLDGKNRTLFGNRVSQGTVTASLVHPREFLKPLILGNATAVIAMHVHPSGDPAPSAEDSAITIRLKQCCELFGINLLDHVIFGEGRFYSFANEGAL